MTITVLGSGAWGTALAILLSENAHTVTLWSAFEEEANTLAATRENPLLKGVVIPKEITVTASLTSVKDAEIVVLATPSFAVGQTAAKVRDLLTPSCIVVNVSKGINKNGSVCLTDAIAAELKEGQPLAVLSGPSHAEEVGRSMVTACVAASEDEAVARTLQNAFMNHRFRVYTSTDMLGVELGGALKNVIALAAGILDGMGNGDNAKAALMTRGMYEISRLGVALGGKTETFSGLTGIGDLIVTCTSMHSRNRRCGILIGEGVPVGEALTQIGAVVEGYYAAEKAYQLSVEANVELPIVTEVYQVLYEEKAVSDAIDALMQRDKKQEATT